MRSGAEAHRLRDSQTNVFVDLFYPLVPRVNAFNRTKLNLVTGNSVNPRNNWMYSRLWSRQWIDATPSRPCSPRFTLPSDNANTTPSSRSHRHSVQPRASSLLWINTWVVKCIAHCDATFSLSFNAIRSCPTTPPKVLFKIFNNEFCQYFFFWALDFGMALLIFLN